jgi:hypothetical protein
MSLLLWIMQALLFHKKISLTFGFLAVTCNRKQHSSPLMALSNNYLENDIIAVQVPGNKKPRLCAVKQYGYAAPLCQHEDNVETDLFVDPRYPSRFYEELTDADVQRTYGEGFYGQRPVPSLGGGPGYGALADEIWSIDESMLEQIFLDDVDLPVLDVGISHGEKARGGAW